MVSEVAYAGGVYNVNNTSYYLYTGQNYWTMSPSNFVGGSAVVFGMYRSGSLDFPGADSIRGVRPVVNLRADVQISSGNGTSSNPYVIS